MTTPLLEVRNITKSFGRVKALQDVSCKVRAGEVTAVLGDNGAGKSTFIKTLSGVHPPETGEYLVAGALLLSSGRSPSRHRDRVPGPGIGAPDADLAELLSRV